MGSGLNQLGSQIKSGVKKVGSNIKSGKPLTSGTFAGKGGGVIKKAASAKRKSNASDAAYYRTPADTALKTR